MKKDYVLLLKVRGLPRGTGDDFELPWQTTVLLRNTSPRTVCSCILRHVSDESRIWHYQWQQRKWMEKIHRW